MRVVISGYGRMGHMIEAALNERGVGFAGASEDITSFDKAGCGSRYHRLG